MPEAQRPLLVEFAGPMCTPFTPFGKREALADGSMESYHLWMEMVRVSGFDAVFMEDSPLFPFELFKSRMEPEYLVKRIRFGNEDLGYPSRRLRTYAAVMHSVQPRTNGWYDC